MKTSLAFTSALTVLLAATLAPPAFAYTWGGKLDMTAVAEQADPAAAPAAPTAAQPVYFVAYDGGYIEAGDPIAGERPPTAAVVAQGLAAALAAQHYLPAGTSEVPSLLLIYHWGRLSRDSTQVRTINTLQPNLLARIRLVSPRRYSQRIEEDLLDRRQPVAVHLPIFDITERDLLQLIGDNRYFVAVSAYDFASVAQGNARLAWRVKLSTRSAGVAMDEALLAMIRAGAPFLGRDLDTTQYLRATVAPAEAAAPGGTSAVPATIQSQLNPAYVQGLIRRDHALFTGELGGDVPATEEPTPTADSRSSYLPAALMARVRAYEREKAALQGQLTALIKTHTPGADTGRAIDDFNRANAARIAALAAEREAIRDDLARLAAATTDSAAGKSLQALQQEFAADVRQLAAEDAGGDHE